MSNILLVEDEVHVVSFIKKGLTEEGFEVSVAFDGKMGLDIFHSNEFDLVILDIMMPEMNGLEVIKEIRKANETIPVLFLSALGTSENIVLGLGLGADDYLVKPFKFIELLARIKSLLRRSEKNKNEEGALKDDHIYTFMDLVINDSSKKVMRASTELSLTSTEYRLLLYFVKNQKRVLSRIDILDEVWGVNYDMGTNVVDVYINYLRKKLELNDSPRIIHTVIGMGYVMKED